MTCLDNFKDRTQPVFETEKIRNIENVWCTDDTSISDSIYEFERLLNKTKQEESNILSNILPYSLLKEVNLSKCNE